jgi:hypothetical protein
MISQSLGGLAWGSALCQSWRRKMLEFPPYYSMSPKMSRSNSMCWGNFDIRRTDGIVESCKFGIQPYIIIITYSHSAIICDHSTFEWVRVPSSKIVDSSWEKWCGLPAFSGNTQKLPLKAQVLRDANSSSLSLRGPMSYPNVPMSFTSQAAQPLSFTVAVPCGAMAFSTHRARGASFDLEHKLGPDVTQS